MPKDGKAGYSEVTKIKQEQSSATRNLIDTLKTIDKFYWYVREPYGKDQWAFILGTNWNSFPEFKKINFYRTDNPKGEEILKKLTYTAKELINA